MKLTHICPICGKNYLRDILLGTPNPDKICPQCEVKNFLTPPLKYYVNGAEVTKEEYDRFTGGNCNE